MASAKVLPKAYITKTYGTGKDYTEGNIANWEQATDINMTALTTIASEAASGQKDVVLTDATPMDDGGGWETGDTITLDPGGANEETHTVASRSSNTLTMEDNLTNTHSAATDVAAGFVLDVYKEGASGALWSDWCQFRHGTTSEDFHRVIKAATDNAFHDNDPPIPKDDGSCAGFKVTRNGYMFYQYEDWIQFHDLVGKHTMNHSTWQSCFTTAYCNDTKMIGCVTIDCDNAGSGGHRSFYLFTECYAINCASLNSYQGFNISASSRAQNCTAVNNSNIGFYGRQNNCTVDNCLADNNTANDYRHASTTWNAQTCMSSDDTSPTTSLRNKTSIFVDADNGDFRLAGGDAVDAGTDLSATFDDDAFGVIRTTPWDIGFHDFVVDVIGIPIKQNVPWQKPYRGVQLNTEHPLAKGLFLALVFNERTGDKVYNAVKIDEYTGTLGSDIVWSANGIEGSDATNNTVTFSGGVEELKGATEVTIVTKAKPHADTGTGQDIASIWATTPSSDRIFRLGFAAAENIWNGWWNDGDYVQGNWGAVTFGAWHSIASYYKAGDEINMYINGEKQTPVSASASTTLRTTNEPLRMMDRDAGDKGLDGEIEYIYIYNRVLSEGEIQWLHREPYSMFVHESIISATMKLQRAKTIDIDALLKATGLSTSFSADAVLEWESPATFTVETGYGQQKPPRGTQVNLGHPLAKGLIAAYPFNERDGEKICDYVGSIGDGILTGASNWNNQGLYTDNDQYVSFSEQVTDIITNRFSVVWIGTPVELSSTRRYFFCGQYSSSDTGYDWGFYIGNTPYKVSFYVDAASGPVGNANSDDENLAVGVETCLVGTYDGPASETKIYFDGIWKGTDTDASGSVNDTQPFKLGRNWSAGVNYSRIRHSLLLIYNRCLTPEEVTWITREPYAMFTSTSTITLPVKAVAQEYGAIEVTTGSPTQKPVRGTLLNREHPLANGLFGAWVMNEFTGDIHNLAQNKYHGPLGSASLWSANGIEGTDSANSKVDFAETTWDEIDLTTELTIVVKVITHATTGTGQDIVSKQDTGGVATDRTFRLTFTGAGNIWCQMHEDHSIGTDEFSQAWTTFSFGEWYTIVLTYKAGNVAQCFVNDIDYGTVSTSAMGGLQANNIPLMFLNNENDDKPLDGEIEFCYLYDRVLTEEEISLVTREPYAMFVHKSFVFFPLSAETGAQTYTVTTDIDSLLQRTGITETTSIDSLLMKSLSIDMSVDSLLQALKTGTFVTDALLQGTGSTTFDIDSLLQHLSLTSTLSADALLKMLGSSAVINIDALLEWANPATFTVETGVGTHKPPRGTLLNTNHPLARGLVGCWVMNEGGGDKIFDLSGSKLHGTLDGVEWGKSEKGLILDLSDNADHVDFDRKLFNEVVYEISAEVIYRADAVSSARMLVTHGSAYNTTSFYIDIESSKAINMLVNSGATTARRSSLVTAATGVWKHVVGTWSGLGGAAFPDVYDDGLLSNSTTWGSAVASCAVGDSNLIFGQESDGQYYFLGDIALIRIWNRKLTAEEVAWLHREPYAMFTSQSVISLPVTVVEPEVTEMLPVPVKTGTAWQKPPRGTLLNKSHPMAKGLIACYLANEGTGDRLFDLSGNRRHLGNNEFTAIWDDDRLNHHDSKKVDGSWSGRESDENSCTVVLKAHPTDTTSNNYAEYGYYISGGTTNQKNLRCIIIGFQNDNWNIYNRGVYPIDNNANNSKIRADVDTDQTIAYGSDGSIVKGWKNGEKMIEGAGHLDLHDSSPLRGLILGGSVGNNFDGYIYHFYYYDRLLTDEEIAWLHREPYAMFQHESVFALPVPEAEVAVSGVPVKVGDPTQKPMRGTLPNFNHPLAADLFCCYAFNEKGGDKAYDLAWPGRTGNFSGDVSWVAEGVSIGTSQDRVTISTDGINTAEGTLEMIVVVNSWSGDTYFWDSDADRFLLYEHGGSLDLFTGNTYRGGSSTPFSLGVKYHIVVTWPDNKLYIDGGKTILNYNDGGLGNIGSTLYIGDRFANTNQSLDGEVHLFRLYNKRKTPVEITALARNPYAMFVHETIIPIGTAEEEEEAVTYTVTSDMDALLKSLGQTATVDIDSLIQMRDQTAITSLDSLIKVVDNVETTDIDSILKTIGSTSIIDLDALLKTEGLSNFINIDSLLQTSGTGVTDIDALLRMSGTTTTDIDSILKATDQSQAVSIDGLLQTMGITASTSIDSILKNLGAYVTTDLDAVLVGAGQVLITTDLDAILKAEGVTFSCDIDALLKTTDVTGATSIDSLLQTTGVETIGMDSILQKAMVESILIDALLKTSKTGNFAVDSVLAYLRTISTSMDAIISSGAFTVSIDIDALLQKAGTISNLLDAILAAEGVFPRYIFLSDSETWTFSSPTRKRSF